MVQPAAQWPWYQSAEWTAVGWPVEALLSAAPAPALSPVKEKNTRIIKWTVWLALHMNKSTDYQSFLVQEVTLMEVNLLGQNKKKIHVLLRISPESWCSWASQRKVSAHRWLHNSRQGIAYLFRPLSNQAKNAANSLPPIPFSLPHASHILLDFTLLHTRMHAGKDPSHIAASQR